MPHSYRILALDGGGIRGLMTALWLERLERELGKPLREHFDLIAGTSTGGILACAAAIGLDTSAMVALYREHGREIFPALPSRLWSRLERTLTLGPSAPKYSDDGLKAVLQRVFGEKKFSDVEARNLLLVTSYNTLTREPLVMKSNHAEHDDLRLWEVAKATSSAPTYFPAHELRLGQRMMPLIDGGVVANNPTACAIAEAVKLNAQQPEGCKLEAFVVASFGTGQSTRPIAAKEAKEWGALEWAIPIIDVLMDGASDATDYVARHVIPEGRYFRFQTPLHAAYDDLDRADDTNLNALANQAVKCLESAEWSAKITQLADLLRSDR